MLYLCFNCDIAELFDIVFKSSVNIDDVLLDVVDCDRPIVAKLLISDIEFFMSLRSRFKACAFISDVDRTCRNLCDDECDVNVLDVVVLLLTT